MNISVLHTGFYEYFYIYSLKRHLMVAHTGLEFKCAICMKIFRRQDRLDEHMTIHTGLCNPPPPMKKLNLPTPIPPPPQKKSTICV